MKSAHWNAPRSLATWFLGATLWLSVAGLHGFAQEPPLARLGAPQPLPAVVTGTNEQPALDPGKAGTDYSLAPTVPAPVPAAAWNDPVSRVPNFFGDFFARGSKACVTSPTTFTSQILTYTGNGAGFPDEGNTAQLFGVGFSSDIDVIGPGGPFVIQAPITGTGTFPNYTADEHAQLSSLVRLAYPGAAFLNGVLTFVPQAEGDGSFLFNYLFTSGQLGQTVCVNLPNPSGGGLVGRNKYFDNGSPLPRDRVYFFHNYVGSFQGLGTPFDLQRYTFGAEKTFLADMASVEVRVPFAGTGNSDQVGGQPLAVDNAEFGNIGVVLKGVLYRTPFFVTSVGLGVSLPTANDSRMLLGSRTAVKIQNDTWLLQPLLGLAWAPTERFYTQAGLQFDLAPNGNPVLVASGNGDLARAGVLTDQGYVYLSGAAGYWLYQNAAPTRALTGVALQGELHYTRSFGSVDVVQSGNVVVADLGSQIDVLNTTAGLHFLLGDRAIVAVGASLPLSGDRVYDWNVFLQFNYYFGAGLR